MSSGESLSSSLLRFLRSPVFWSLVTALIVRFIPVGAFLSGITNLSARRELIDFAGGVGATIHLVANATIPVVLVAVGILLRPSALKSCVREVSIIALLRLGVAPVIGFLTAKYILHICDPALLQTCVMVAGLPPSANAAMFCNLYELDDHVGVAAFFALTLCSSITLPVLMSLLR